MGQEKDSGLAGREETARKELGLERMERRLDALDERLDNIDTIVSTVAERIMARPITIGITCPNCGQTVEVAIVGSGMVKVISEGAH